jgi:mono/diheme cytochrome c family protein
MSAAAGQAAPAAAADDKTIWDGVFTDEQRRAGAQAATAACSSCHGEGLAGDIAPPVVGSEFLAAWSGKTVGELYEKVQTTMPADSPGTLRPQQAADMVAYILYLNDARAGENRLEPERAALNQIKIRPKR